MSLRRCVIWIFASLSSHGYLAAAHLPALGRALVELGTVPSPVRIDAEVDPARTWPLWRLLALPPITPGQHQGFPVTQQAAPPRLLACFGRVQSRPKRGHLALLQVHGEADGRGEARFRNLN